MTIGELTTQLLPEEAVIMVRDSHWVQPADVDLQQVLVEPSGHVVTDPDLFEFSPLESKKVLAVIFRRRA